MSQALFSLDTIRIASPCHASWDDMDGDERARFCGHCRRPVYNLAGMTRRQAEDLVTEREGQACVRLFRRTDGTLLTSDCPVGARAWRYRLLLKMTALGLLTLTSIAWGVGLLVSSGDDPPHAEDRVSLVQRLWNIVFPPKPAPPPFVMGKICVKE